MCVKEKERIQETCIMYFRNSYWKGYKHYLNPQPSDY